MAVWNHNTVYHLSCVCCSGVWGPWTVNGWCLPTILLWCFGLATDLVQEEGSKGTLKWNMSCFLWITVYLLKRLNYKCDVLKDRNERPHLLTFMPERYQAAAWRLLIPRQSLPLSLGLTLHLGRPPEPQWDGYFLLGDGRASEILRKQIMLFKFCRKSSIYITSWC